MTKIEIDISKTLDNRTEFITIWKTLVRELLLKQQDGCTYNHDNIVGNRPYHVHLKINIDEPVNYNEDKTLHDQAKEYESNILLYDNVFCELLGIVVSNNLLTDELKENLTTLGVEYQ